MNEQSQRINALYDAEYNLRRAYNLLHEVVYKQDAKYTRTDLAEIRDVLHAITIDEILPLQTVIADMNYRDPNEQ